MAVKLLVDTDVLVDFLRGHKDAVDFIRTSSERIVLSAVTVAELYAGVRDGMERRELDEFVALFPVIAVQRDIAAAAGLYHREHSKSHGVGLADATVAATARREKAGLRTLNVKHYPDVSDVEAPYSK